MKREVIITGASGFVGNYLTDYLQLMNYEVIKLSLRNSNGLKQKNEEKSACAIIHLAGKAHDTNNVSSDLEYFKVNTDLTILLFDEFLKSDVRDFFFFSSVKAVADSVVGVLQEDVECNPLTPYGRSKYEAEQYLLTQDLPDNKRLFIIRPCMIHGPGNKGNLNLLYKIVKKGIPWPLSAFHNERSFLSIDNLSYLIETMIKDPQLHSGIYNFADDDALSTNEVVKIISESLGRTAKLWSISTSLIRAVVRMGDILPLPLNSERLKKLTESYVVSNAKIKSALGIEKLPVCAKEGLIKTIQSFRS